LLKKARLVDKPPVYPHLSFAFQQYGFQQPALEAVFHKTAPISRKSGNGCSFSVEILIDNLEAAGFQHYQQAKKYREKRFLN
jgi:hypothetical protein